MTDPSQDFRGLRVVSFESRRAEAMRTLIRRHGGQALVAPSMREIPLQDQQEAFQFAQRLFAHTIDVLILLTGVGTRTLIEILESRYPKPKIVEALSNLTLVARGPKPIIALGAVGLKPTLTVPEPNTWRDLLATLDAKLKLKGLCVAVQEYGVSNVELLDGLSSRGVEVIRVGVYRWALPEDIEPLRQAIQAVCHGQADVLLFTSAQQIEHVLQVARSIGVESNFQKATSQCVVASIGPICSEALGQHGLAADVEPTHPHMGPLLSEAAKRSWTILKHKRDKA